YFSVRQYFVHIQKHDHLAPHLPHSEYEFRIHLGAEGGRVFYLIAGHVQHFGYLVDEQAHDYDSAVPGNLDHDDAGPLGIRHGIQVEFAAQLDYGDYLAPEVEHAAHEGRGFRNAGHRHHADDFLHLEYFDSENLLSKLEGEVLALTYPGRSGRLAFAAFGHFAIRSLACT